MVSPFPLRSGLSLQLIFVCGTWQWSSFEFFFSIWTSTQHHLLKSTVRYCVLHWTALGPLLEDKDWISGYSEFPFCYAGVLPVPWDRYRSLLVFRLTVQVFQLVHFSQDCFAIIVTLCFYIYIAGLVFHFLFKNQNWNFFILIKYT